MSAKADDYRKKAEEAEQSASTATDFAAKRTYGDIAKHYRYLSEQQDRMDAYTRCTKRD